MNTILKSKDNDYIINLPKLQSEINQKYSQEDLVGGVYITNELNSDGSKLQHKGNPKGGVGTQVRTKSG